MIKQLHNSLAVHDNSWTSKFDNFSDFQKVISDSSPPLLSVIIMHCIHSSICDSSLKYSTLQFAVEPYAALFSSKNPKAGGFSKPPFGIGNRRYSLQLTFACRLLFACRQPNCHIAGSEFQSALHQLYCKSSHFNWHCRKIMNTADTSFVKWWWRWIVFVVWLIDEKHLALFSVRTICQRSPPSRFCHTMGRVLTCPEPEIWLSSMELNYTMAKLLLWT